MAAERPAEPSPSESFRRWIKQKFSGYASAILATDDEQGLVGVGVHRYRLAQVLATHIVRDVATEREIRLERDLDGASCNSTVGSSGQAAADDQKLREFFEQVAPILTQHRGINAKSRAMMNAIAEHLGLTETELEQALATLQRLGADPNENDPRQIERRESFRKYLRRAMAQLPHGIITFKTETRLIEAGEHFHGVAPPWIKPIVNEVASEIGARFISKQQAIAHIQELVVDIHGDKPVIDSTTRARIYTEGTRWGLDPMDVESILRERTETLRRQLAVERRRTRWVLNLAVAGSVIAIAVLAWMLFPRPPNRAAEQLGNASQAQKKTPERSGPSWWNKDLRIATAKLRMARPDLRPAVEQLAQELPSQRQQAYRKLVTQFMSRLPRLRQQNEMQMLLASLYALEPVDYAAEELAHALLGESDALEKGLPQPPDEITTIFWRCRTAVAMLKHTDVSPTRSAQLAALLETLTLEAPDRLLETEPLERRCCAALSRRLYQLLIRSVADDPASASQSYFALCVQAQQYLESAALDRLDVEYLAAMIPLLGEDWDRCADALRRTALAEDPTTVIETLDIYRHASDARLRNFIASLFFERLGAAPGTLTESEMIEGIRQSLGVASRENDNRRWNLLAVSSNELLERKRVARTNPDVLLQETIEMAHAATLACALAQGESGGPIFDELHMNGAVKLALGGGPWATVPPKAFEPSYPVSGRTVLRNSINSLAGARSASQRVDLLRLISNQVGSVSDIDLPSGLILAEYLAQFKPDEQEHEQMLRYAPRLCTWNAVRLGLADQLLAMPGRDIQLQRLLSRVLDGDVNLNTEAGRASARRRLLSQVSTSLSEMPDTDDPQWRVFDEGSQALVSLYTQQAKLLGASAEDYATARNPSAIVAVLIRHLAAQLSGTKLDAADRALLDELPYRLRAIDFVAENDLQYTAALQQIWLQLLAIQVAQQQPAKAVAIRELRQESVSRGSQGERVLEQLRDLQTSLLRIWMLLRPDSEETGRGA